MTQNTNLNVSPYFDDFDEDKNYNKVLFKPGFPIQSRELTTLQSILQGQIERFGQHFFKEGSMIVPGGIIYDSNYFAVKIDPSFLDVPVSVYTTYLKDNNIEIQGENSGVKATVVNCLTAAESIDNVDTIYVKYTSSGIDGITPTFVDGETLITLEEIKYSNTAIAPNNPFARTIVSEATPIGSAASISEGIFFIRGYFVKVPADTVILDQYSNSPSFKVGLRVSENIATASSENEDLYDNAKGFSNESAPGADRLQISASLVKKSLTDNNDANFVELLRVEKGLVQRLVNRTDYNIFKDELARRTYDESGDYYVKKFAIDIRETLNDRLGNKGIYAPGQLTQRGNTPSDDLFTLQISSGKAYVKGYEVEKVGSTSLDNNKPRTTQRKENVSVPIRIGNTIQVENLYGAPTIGFNNTYTVELKDQRLDDDGLTQGNVIGNARVYDFSKKNIAGIGTERFDLRLFDIQTFTTLTLGLGVSAGNSAFVKGVFSGASGHLKDAVTNATTLNLLDVTGQFQLNEPIEINGIVVGRNITAVRDNDIRDVKSIGRTVGVSTFACNVAMQQTENLIKPGSAFKIEADTGSGSAVTSPSVGDFRNVPVRVNDVVSFTIPGQNLPTFNRVSAVSQSQITLSAVSDVVGVCTGGTVKAANGGTLDNVQNLNVTSGILERGKNPGKIVNLPNTFISSINLLDSSYTIRKQASVTVGANLQLSFAITDFGDDALFLEPYTQFNYSLTYGDGHKEIILDSQVTISNDLKTIDIKGLSKAGAATLTITCKRSTLSSKVKSIERCRNLVVARSGRSGSGIGSTTFDDGLDYGDGTYPYGTRVQDENISLNVPDVTRVYAVFESNDNTAPDLPSIIVSSQSDTFSNNVAIGEQIVGSETGAVARVVDVVSGNQVNFVYENDKKFQILESVSFQSSSITANINTLFIGDRNVSNDYDLDAGQRPEYCDIARINRVKGTPEPTRQLRIVFDRLTTQESSGTVESVSSYNNLDYSREIPRTPAGRASDFIDLRPRVNEYTLGSSDSPFAFESRSFSNSLSETAVSDTTLIVDYSHYLGRIDRLYLTKDGEFLIKKGEPSEFPKLPVGNSEGFEIGILNLSPYMFDATLNSRLKLIPHKRFTMKDIGVIEGRVKNLEDYTTLSLLETDTKNLSIKDPNTGLDKFKSGFFVDNFRSHNGANLRGEARFDIDLQRGELRPRSTERNVTLQFETVTTEANPTNADYAWANDFSDVNVTRRGPGLTLNFEEVPFIDQPLATRTENLNPYHIALYSGSIDLSPATDYWIEEVVLATPDIVQVDSVFNGMAELLAVEDRENGGMAASWWNSSDFTWNGDDRVFDTQLVGSTVIASSSGSSSSTSTNTTFSDFVPGLGIQATTTTTTTNSSWSSTTFEDEFRDTAFETGTENVFGLELSSGNERISLGDRVIGIETIHNCRSRNIHVTGTKLKPNTKYYVFMESVDMNEFAFPKTLPVVMNKGSFKTGDTVSSIGVQQVGAAQIRFRAAQHNHEIGPFNAPTTVLNAISASYSGTSEFINVDLADLSNQTQPANLGYVKEGMVLVNSDGTAECTVGSTQLMTDDKGEIQFSLHIPDPVVAANPKFTTGSSTIRLTSSAINSPVLDPGGSSAETDYLSSGYSTSYEEQVLSIKQPDIERRFVESLDALRLQQNTRFETRTETESSSSSSSESVTGEYFDPLAQSFLITAENDNGTNSDGVYVTGGEVYFKTKDPSIPVTVQIRTMRDGTPTVTVVPFGQVNIQPKDISVSDDGSVPTEFKFDTPVYLQTGYEYALTLVAPTEKYLAFITRMGEEDLQLKAVYNKQPYLGSLFKSQNQSTWTPSQLEDLKFKLNKAKFVTNTPVSVSFYNSILPRVGIRKNNPVTTFSKRQSLGIGVTVEPFAFGNEIQQGTNSGNIFAFGGPLKVGMTTALVQPTAGVGLTNGTFNGVGFESLTGFGVSCTANVVVSAGAVDTITIANGGAGYQVGDLLLMNQLGNTGSGVRVTVGVSTLTNLLVVDNVKTNFAAGSGYNSFNSNGVGKAMSNIEYVNDDPIRDGKTMKFDHFNHGMHSPQNKLRVYNVASDIAPSTLSADLNDGDSVINLAVGGGAEFATFEGAPVGAANTGYVLIDQEIIAYETISGDVITIESRNFNSAVTGSLLSSHKQNTNVFKYEANGVSLLKINKIHDIDPRERTFNSYHVSLSDTTKTFSTTKAIGGDNVQLTQNVPFEYIRPSINLVSPSGTTISARMKTTSGSSIDGTEASFSNIGYETIVINQLNRLDSPRMIASQVNETELLGGEKSFELEMLLSTTDENVSPMVDLDTTNITIMSNLINNPDIDYTTDSRINIPGFDPHSAIYETKRINLEFTSNSMFVQFDGHRMGDSNFRVFYRLFRNDENDTGQTYVPFNTDGSPDRFVNPNQSENGFSEYKYTAENTPQFNGFQLKIVMTSPDQSEAPRVKNLRAIALRTFDSEE